MCNLLNLNLTNCLNYEEWIDRTQYLGFKIPYCILYSYCKYYIQTPSTLIFTAMWAKPLQLIFSRRRYLPLYKLIVYHTSAYTAIVMTFLFFCTHGCCKISAEYQDKWTTYDANDATYVPYLQASLCVFAAVRTTW